MNAEAQSTEALSARRGGDDAYLSPTIRRRALYFASGERKIFGWYHSSTRAEKKNCIAVICHPLGYEYTHSHRPVRHLADQLADSGIPTLRFDYDATGDSPGDDLAPGRVACWLQDIRAAVVAARGLSGCDSVCLLGIRMGAALAARVACEGVADHLVLWNPCINGRHYMREMKALALTGEGDTDQEQGIESAGFTFLHETAEQLKAFNLLTLPFRRECAVLLVQRDDIEFDPGLENYLSGLGIDVTQVALPGYADMMVEAQYTVVPRAAIAAIVAWLNRKVAKQDSAPSADIVNTIVVDSAVMFAHNGVSLREELCHFGDTQQLFGVWTELAAGRDRTKPTVVFLNAGSAHHIGPHRCYVGLARKFAVLGFGCLRFDLEGLGDSYTAQHRQENHPYPNWAGADTQSALQFLRAEYGCDRFVLMGMCSGAYTVFHAGIDLMEYDVAESILINPLTFYWSDGMTLATTQTAKHFQTVAYYRQSARSARSWLKLMKGQVNVIYLARVGWSQLKLLLKSQFDSFLEALNERDRTQLAIDLKRYFQARRRLSIFVSSRDPGYDILMAGAKRVASKAIAANKIDLQFIDAADHTFSRRVWRMELAERIAAHLCARY